MKPPPCIKDKCITYPACKYKSVVECTPLHSYYLSICPSRVETKHAWKMIKEFLPNLTGIFRDTKRTQFKL